MVAYLRKIERSEGFQQIVDFLNISHIKYALTENLTIHVSLIQQFWQTAATNTLDSGEVQITATIDGKVKLVSEASIRRHLKLEDSDGITTLPNTEIFEQLTLMGYVSNSDKLTFQKGHFSPQWRFLIHTILHCLSPKKTAWERFSSNIATAIIFLATNRTFNFSKMIFEGMVKNLDKLILLLLSHKKLFSNMRRASKGYTRVDIPLFPTMLVQGPILQGEGSTVPVESHHTPSGAPITSKPPLSSPLRILTRQELKGAATTVSSIDAGQGRGNIPKSPTVPYDSPLLGGHTPGSDEGSMTLNELTVKKLEQTVKIKPSSRSDESSMTLHELTVLCTKLSNKEESLEDPSKQGRMIEDIDQDARIYLVTPTKVSSQEDQSEDQIGVLSATNVLADAAKKNVNTYTRRRRVVSTGSEGVSTASRIFSTAEESDCTAGASMPVSTASRDQQEDQPKDKGKVIMQESEQPKKIKKRVQIQMSLDEELAQKLHEEEQIQVDEDLAQKLLEEERENLSIEERARLLAELIDKRKNL
ncbi:hypothetical protein Tco_1524124 [Tanacetum coccineum]